jgi:SulP family sulfate permease
LAAAGTLEDARYGVLPTEYVILDFNGVSGVDGTAARTCFAALFRTLSAYDIKLVLTRVNPQIKALLVVNGLVEAEDTEEEPEKGGLGNSFPQPHVVAPF